MENNSQSPDSPENNKESIFTGEDFSIRDYEKQIRQARNAIFITAAVLTLNLVILIYNIQANYEYLWIDIALWGSFILGFLALGFWTNQKPYYAIIGALLLYSSYIILHAVFDISTIYKGFIFKIAIIVFLVKGLKNAKDAQEMKKMSAEH